MIKNIVLISICCMMLLATIVFPVENCRAYGITIYVDDDWEDDPPNHRWNTIQEGVDDAENGDTVFVYGGIYHENVVISKAIDLIGEDKSITIVDGDNLPVFKISTNYVSISDFTIMNAMDATYGFGVWVQGSHNEISNNIITENMVGIVLKQDSDHNVIEYNSIFENGKGMEMYFGSDYNTIQYNTIYDNIGNGIVVICSVSCSFLGNDFSNDGIQFTGPQLSYYLHNVADNMVNDKPLYYYKNQDGITVPSNAGQIIIVNCNDVTIAGVNIANTDPGILAVFSSDIVISNSHFSDNKYGILLQDCSDVIIQYNEFFFSNGLGAHIWVYDSNNVIIQENDISLHGGMGIQLAGDSYYNIIRDNTITSNDQWGIWTTAACNYNEIYHNNFLDNSDNARDSDNNQWDDGYPSGGNFWDDYTGSDEDEDGIGDTPYYIYDGSGRDQYPLMSPTRNVPPKKPNKPNGPVYGKIGETYDYTTSSIDHNGDQIYYMWDWDDGDFSDWLGPYDSDEICTASHTWSENGGYKIKVKAKDIYDYESDWSDPLSTSMPYSVDMDASQQFVVLGQAIQFRCSAIGGNEPYTFEWDFEDGNFSEQQNTTHAYNTVGSYTVTLNVTDSQNITSNITQVIDVVILNADFNTSLSGCSKINETIYFNDTSAGYNEIVNWSWDFGDGDISYDQNTSHEYTVKGPYKVILNVTDNESNKDVHYHIIHIDSVSPEIISVSASPDIVGFGFDVAIITDVTDDISGIGTVKVDISYPNGSSSNYTMSSPPSPPFIYEAYAYEYAFSDTWQIGQYNYTIWAVDKAGNSNSSSGHSFNVSAQTNMSVCAVKDSYGTNEIVNLTDPPGPPSQSIGYDLLDDDSVLHIWNKYDSYYFNTSNGIQFTNHKDEYWSHNVLMLGYYNNDEWNLIYRTDELSGFNKEIDSDDETYVNATLWKDLSYGGYDFRLAIRYHLGVDDNELTVIPYIKNIDDEDIPYTLGFAWEINDIQVDMTPENDYIEIDGTWYYLNGTIDETYTDLDLPCYYIKEDKSENMFESLYLRWDEDLNYKVLVESREGQYNAPVTLGIKIGTLDIGQEKYTEMFWHDASEVTYYFNNYDPGEAWIGNPANMVDGNISTYASTNAASSDSVELCNGNTYPRGTDLGTISKVELRAYGYYSGSQRDIILRPVFEGTDDGSNYTFQTPWSPTWSSWFNIANDSGASTQWNWEDDIAHLDCDVEAEDDFGMWTLYCSKVEIRVTYTPHPTEISDPYPADGSTGVSIQPMLNITVSDPQGDTMNITWLSNSSLGDNSSNNSWVAFGSNSSVGNGTYHQVFADATENGQWWYWKVNVSDGTSYIESDVFSFYTGYQSKIENIGSTDIKGYLLIQVQFYNDTLEDWVVADDTINETSWRRINSSEYLALDTIFNGNVNTSDLLASHGSGTYRVYAAFRDPDGDVLVCDDESLMEATYPFTVTYD